MSDVVEERMIERKAKRRFVLSEMADAGWYVYTVRTGGESKRQAHDYRQMRGTLPFAVEPFEESIPLPSIVVVP